MNLSQTLKMFRHAVSENSPSILTGLGVAGTVSTALLSARAAFRVGKDVNAGHYEMLMDGKEPEAYDAKALFQTYWQEFIPPVLTGAGTVACIIGANHISSKRIAAVVSAYSVSETLFKEYKDKVVETLGEKKELAMRDQMAQERITANPPSNNEIVITDKGEVLCYETLSGRYFKSEMQTLRKAMNDINAQIIADGYASLGDFWSLIGLQNTTYGEEVGWTVDEMLDLHFSTVLSEDDKPCISVGYKTLPTRNYYRFN